MMHAYVIILLFKRIAKLVISILKLGYSQHYQERMYLNFKSSIIKLNFLLCQKTSLEIVYKEFKPCIYTFLNFILSSLSIYKNHLIFMISSLNENIS